MIFNVFSTKKTLARFMSRIALVVVAVVLCLVENAPLWANDVAEIAQNEKLDPMAWKSDLAIWTAVVFLLLIVVLGKFAFDPIVKALDQREKNELNKFDAIERTQADAKAVLAEYNQKLAESKDEVRRIIADAKDEATRQANDIVEDARKAADAERERALKDIQNASDSALQNIAVKTADLATSLAGKILKEQIDPAKNVRLIEDAVKDLTTK